MSRKITGISRLDIVWELDLHLPMQSVPITTSIVSSKPALTWLDTTLCEKFVSDLQQVCGLLRVHRFSPPIKLTSTIYKM